MKASKKTRHGIFGLSGAALLLSTLLVFASCTRDDMPHDPKDTTQGTTAGTTVGTADDHPGSSDTKPSGNGGTGAGTAKPLDPNAGTVVPDNNAGDPPAGTGESRNFRSRFMH